MNEQNSDSSATPISQPIVSPLEKLSETTKVKQSLFAKWRHKKTELPAEASSPASTSATASPTPSVSQKKLSLLQRVQNILPKKKHPSLSPNAVSAPVQEWVSPQASATPFVMDERFARLLEQDNTYHSMIRSEDIQNIQLQLAMRYMLLLLAIFVVIVWVVNNRVIMFWFSDFPLLARTRDGLFALLTGLFALTVWFGAAVWFRNIIATIILRSLWGILFLTVLISIYLPFWR